MFVITYILVTFLTIALASTTNEIDGKVSVAIIGAAGYIGSFLGNHLTKQGFQVIGFDKNPLIFNTSFEIRNTASSLISKDEINSVSVIVYLGGCTGRVSCEKNRENVENENVKDILHLAKRMRSDQLLIFATTSGIYEGTGRLPGKENDIHNKNMLDTYCKSLFQREKDLRKLYHHRNHTHSVPAMIGLRFGTVIGVSLAQRTDLFIPSIFKSAYSTGVIKLNQPNSYRAFLWLQDLAEGLTLVIKKYKDLKIDFDIFNLQTFSASMIKVATTAASITGARIEINETRTPSLGFSMDSSKFEETFGFKPKGYLTGILKEFDKNVPASITSKGPHMPPNVTIGNERKGSIPCPVCGSHYLQEVLDLHEQPFANNFQKTAEASLKVSTYPLKLMRCKVCNHVHLAYVAEREALFDDYLYQSGTSSTLLKYFDWLSDKIQKEVDEVKGDHTVLEIACNDGSQLDKFKGKGWKTFGVDPAANIVPIAQGKGHEVMVGYWGTKAIPNVIKMKNFPEPDKLGAIVAQNVFAHVPNPVDFLIACEKIMGKNTKVYIQTSQCQMIEEGQYDTAYHEHISFFSGFSYKKAAELSNLQITNFELTPIHGVSCLVTFMKKTKVEEEISKAMQLRLQYESDVGINNDFFYMKYRERALKATQWMIKRIKDLRNHGYHIGAYGAAAKGMVLLHYMLSLSTESELGIEFVIDDAKLKQDRYCPGTKILVYATDMLTTKVGSNTHNYGIVILAWNFWDEIASNIVKKLKGKQGKIVCLIPFPSPRMVYLDIESGSQTIISNLPYHVTESPNIIQMPRRRVMLITHFYNEELLLPYFIRHHANMFDHAILIDYQSDDKSVDIINSLAPPSWRVVPSSTGRSFFPGTPGNDGDVVWYEHQYPNDWKISLTTTEFLVFPDMRKWLYDFDTNLTKQHCFKFPAITMVGNDAKPLEKYTSLPLQRSAYANLGSGTHNLKKRKHEFPKGYLVQVASAYFYERLMHVGYKQKVYTYSDGRHAISLHNGLQPTTLNAGFIMKYLLTPWPESITRKSQISKNIPEKDFGTGKGVQHTVGNTNEAVKQIHDALLEEQQIFDLKGAWKNSAASETHRHFHVIFNEALDPEEIIL